MLQMARLQYSLLPEDQKMENNPQMIAILTGLKDLQIKRKIYSEPIHIEAALDYADIKAKQEGFKLDKTLFLMNKIKEDFAIDATKENSHPDKEALLKNYLKYVDAEILRLKAIAAQETNDAEKAKELLQASLSELTALRDERSLTPYLQKRINKSTEDIKGCL
jgi:hypothetical protein